MLTPEQHAPDHIQAPEIKRRFVLNGRFLTRPVTGVDRVATELTRALLSNPIATEGVDWQIDLALPKADLHAPENLPSEIHKLHRRAASSLNGHVWEQLGLPQQTKGDLLLSLCNTGPLRSGRQAVMIHDAQVFTQPETYSRSFRLIYHQLLPRLARRAQILLTVSAFSRDELERLGVFPKGKAYVIHNGSDHIDRIRANTDILARHGLTDRGYFFAMGSLARHKNLAMLVAAAEARTDRSLPLVIAGGGNGAVFRENGLPQSPSLLYLGRVSDGDLKALYEGARAFVFPSLTEGFGLPPLEAMRCGCPVIATTGGAVPEVCGDGVLYADPHDPSTWTVAMEQLAADPTVAANLAEKGQHHAKNFTWSRAAHQLLECIQHTEEEIS